MMVREVHFDVVFFHARKCGLDHYIILLLKNIHGRSANLHFVVAKPSLGPSGSSSSPEEVLHHPLYVPIPTGEIPERSPRRHRLRFFFFSFLSFPFFPAGQSLAPQAYCPGILLNLFLTCPFFPYIEKFSRSCCKSAT